MNGLKVGEVARQAGVNLQTVHYYERRGLLPIPPRTDANYRSYPAGAVLRVRFIKRAQDLGFTLKEIEELLSLRATPRSGCADVRSWLASTTRFVNDILLSAPSIVIGLFVYAVVVARFKSFSAYAGIFALALIVIPVVIRTTENMLILVPASLREAAYALGTPKWRVITMVTLRAARAGVITGILLAVARIAGETAPLLFTALSNQFWNSDLSKPMASLPVTIFKFAMSPYENWQHLAWAGVFLITVAVLGLNILARVLTRQK